MSTDPNVIHLRIDGSLRETDSTLPDWPAEVYSLDGLARGQEERTEPPPLAADDVLELELADGTRILVAADQATRYLAPAAARGGRGGAALEVGQTLRFSASHLPTHLSRDGLGAWVLNGLRIYRNGPAAMTALAAAGGFQDQQLADRNGLYRCAGDVLGLSKVERMAESAEPALLFIHGTASSTPGSFGDLWQNERYRGQLVERYGAAIYGFEHRSMTVGPIDNALDLARALPRGARLHLVTHSRGGMVGELLARANRVGLEPFVEADIARYLAHGRRAGRSAADADADKLRELNRELVRRQIRIERFVRVAAPLRGTTLASGRLDRWASVMLNLLGGGVGAGLLKGFLLALVRQRCDAGVLPGLEAMMPDSSLVELLNASGVEVAPAVHVLAGDYDGTGLLPWLGDCLSEVFYGGETDLVVNTPSMGGGAARGQGILQRLLRGPQVTHFSYFSRAESADALMAALAGDDSGFSLLAGPSRAAISRGGVHVKPLPKAPIALVLPGIMGSHIQVGKDRIWFDPFSMCAGGMDKLKVNAANVSTDGWMDRNYERLAQFLADSHEVRPFAYDWRLSIQAAATAFGRLLDAAIDDARARGRAVRIVAHSMGGLVARLALKDRWPQFKANPGSRLLQLGTPNNGSHSIAAVLMARDDFIQTIERWFDWKHDMRDFLTIVRDFPGVLELLPWPGADGRAVDGVDYFDPAVWQAWYDGDGDARKRDCWLVPQADPLARARATIEMLRSAPLDPECTLYVAGRSPTPAGVRLADGQVEIGWVEEGDGRVLWRTGIPPGVPVWYADAAHGDLANHEGAFAAYQELIEKGSTSDSALTRAPSIVRGESSPVFRPRSLHGNGLYPSVDEVLAAATGGARPGRRMAKGAPGAIVEVVHGSAGIADAPVMVGAYAGDSVRGSARFLDGHLGGQMQRAHRLGRYPAQPDDAMVFLNGQTNAKPAGAIVVGLGAVGELLPGHLAEALGNGLLEYARIYEQSRPAAPVAGDRLSVATLLVGTGFSGLTVEAGCRCQLEALRRANLALAEAGSPTRIGRLTVFEEAEDRAIAAALALREHVADPRLTSAVRFDGCLRSGAGGYRGRSVASGGTLGGYRVHVVAAADGGLRFTVISDRARNEVAVAPDQRQAVNGLIASITSTTQDQRGLSRALFELMVPNGMKGAVADLRSLMLSLDAEAAVYPWELMRDGDQADLEPLAVRVELVRQLAAVRGRGRVPTVTENKVFIVGDTQSDLPELPGAQAEARAVARVFAANGHEVRPLVRATSLQVFEGLFSERYRYVHLAGHGVVGDGTNGQTGMVLGPKTFLTPAQVGQLRHVPEFVFINCCHLGSTRQDIEPRWSQLAANLATQFIEIGCRAVIAAGWAVDDAAASTFAREFYAAMFQGRRFGQAVLQARAATYRQHPLGNTWGAFQAYGDERYQFAGRAAAEAGEGGYVHASHIIADLDVIDARLQGARDAEKRDYYRNRISAIEAAARGPGLQSAAVRAKLARAWADLGDAPRAIGHYRAALTMEDGGVSLGSLEQLANLEIRHGARLFESRNADDHDQGRRFMEAGYGRLQQLVAIGTTTERLSFIGSYWKRLAQAGHARGYHRQTARCLDEMRRAYWQAAEHAYRQHGRWNYYPLLNALDGDFLCAARARQTGAADRPDSLESLLRAAIDDGRRRYAEDMSFFHALAEIDAARADALWACLDGRAAQAITRPAAAEGLAGRYRELLRRLGTAREHDSVINQIRFLAAMLPAKERGQAIKAALQKLIEAIGSA